MTPPARRRLVFHGPVAIPAVPISPGWYQLIVVGVLAEIAPGVLEVDQQLRRVKMH